MGEAKWGAGGGGGPTLVHLTASAVDVNIVQRGGGGGVGIGSEAGGPTVFIITSVSEGVLAGGSGGDGGRPTLVALTAPSVGEVVEGGGEECGDGGGRSAVALSCLFGLKGTLAKGRDINKPGRDISSFKGRVEAFGILGGEATMPILSFNGGVRGGSDNRDDEGCPGSTPASLGGRSGVGVKETVFGDKGSVTGSGETTLAIPLSCALVSDCLVTEQCRVTPVER